MNKAIELWIEYFRDNGQFSYENGYGVSVCMFCSGRDDVETIDVKHDIDCIWVRAKKLVEESKGDMRGEQS